MYQAPPTHNNIVISFTFMSSLRVQTAYELYDLRAHDISLLHKSTLIDLWVSFEISHSNLILEFIVVNYLTILLLLIDWLIIFILVISDNVQ